MIQKVLTRFLNKLKLHNKFLIMYVFCVIIPLIITDAVVLRAVYKKEYDSRVYEMDKIAQQYSSYMSGVFSYNSNLAQAICDNQDFNHFLDRTYRSNYDYFVNYLDFINNSFFRTIAGMRSDKITIYVDNPTVGDGFYFKPMSSAEDKEWYRRFSQYDVDECLLIYYDETVNLRIEKPQKIIYIRKMRIFDSKYDKLVKIEIDASDMRNQLVNISSEYPMYICNGNYVVFTRIGEAVKTFNAENMRSQHTMYTHRPLSVLGNTLDIYLYSDELLITTVLRNNIVIILSLVLVTVILPVIIMKIIEQSLAKRIQILGEAFSGNKMDKFLPITDVEGNDEITSLMENYNNIVSINNELINTLYKDKLREQESDIARKNAELLALQSQINPHFLFNALESIRMHSILKGEDETAEMVEKLAVMERQNVEWSNDLVTVKKETESIEAYLYLQSYRFGDRLSFDIDVEEDCESYLIPKLTLVTFVENACVHGIESKPTAGWIFVRVYKKGEDLVMEIEDTGGGMTDKEVSALIRSIEHVSIDKIKNMKHVGILNACLRMKMHTDNMVKFSIESEVGVGMCVMIRVPLSKLKQSET